MSKGKILFQLTGSIACFKACGVISRLVQNDFEVEVVATKSALEFVGRATFEGLTGRPVHVEMFESGHYMNHIDLMKWADLAILCPATANTISKLASGLGDDLVSTLFLAHDFKKPYLVSPAMNVKMYSHPSLKAALEKLESWGVRILETGAGRLACGDVGEGRLLEPDQIFDEIISALHGARPLQGQKILVTSGGTREPLDGVRYLTNISSGRTGATMAEAFASAGAEVTYLHAEGAALPENSAIQRRAFNSYVSLENALRDELGSTGFSAVVHAAAVGDYSIASIEASSGSVQAGELGKLDSSGDLQLRLKKNPKLLSFLRSWSRNSKIKVVGFKLTNSPTSPQGEAAVAKLSLESKPDFVVQNDVSEMVDGKHLFRIYDGSSASKVITQLDGAKSLANYLSEIFSSGGQV
ncbi:MAG TPA: bifunctional phosphopantothenoylcysteine decarboxylase/phosphopantothenate--cysteine ligase CoaBC [Bdellovibrionales bacterium]|nr:bifunctional phosphopantothenoylcysteine decarboxylase/phosphopantothenate--cysteine ligase CoaBC [Bdellovibrionales bacterium]